NSSILRSTIKKAMHALLFLLSLLSLKNIYYD
ncbi:MAG: hypothetical protein ACI89M_002312, partial [Chitinophagales bacterium]